MTNKTCAECDRPKSSRSSKWCSWHWLMRQPIEEQVKYAGRRRARAERKPGYEYRSRVPKAEWPEGLRWCSGCQEYIPEFYARGSRCRAHASQAAHASHVERTYLRPDGAPFTGADYQKLWRAQGGCCYICGRKATQRLAVDHSHTTGVVRGLLCSSPDWGCNLKIVGILEGATDPVASARRLLGYLEGDTPAARYL